MIATATGNWEIEIWNDVDVLMDLLSNIFEIGLGFWIRSHLIEVFDFICL